MTTVEERLRTFDGWSSRVVHAHQLADAGFSYLGRGDIVQCHSCKGQLKNWEPGDEAWSEHARHFPWCLFVQIQRPAVIFRVQSTAEHRRATFRDWPMGSVAVSDLVKAGFFHAGRHGEVTCHRCLVTLSGWKAGDDVWKQHHVESPGCLFLLQHSPYVPVMMGNKMHRYCSFTYWPKKDAVSVADLVQAGFHYTGEGDRVACAVCDIKLDRWEYGDQPMQEHCQNSPSCRLLHHLNPEAPPTSQNIIDNVTVADRLATFWCWSTLRRVDPTLLASAGFVYTGSEDKVCCHCCNGTLGQWEDDDHPWLEHFRHFRGCSFVLRKAPLAILSAKMASLSERQATFEGWPTSAPTDANSLAEAGFFFCGVLDSVRCHTCGVNLSHWQNGDEAWTEHRRHSPLCSFLERQPPRPVLGSHLHRVGGDGMSTLTSMGFSLAQIEAAMTSLSSSSVPITFDSVLNRLIGQSSASGSSPVRDRLKFDTTTHAVQESSEGKPAVTTPTGTDQDRHICKVCWEAEIGVLFQPCRHLACCVNCAPRLSLCPICQAPITSKDRAFLP